jgi:F-type H+-transporting ATPase subunit b
MPMRCLLLHVRRLACETERKRRAGRGCVRATFVCAVAAMCLLGAPGRALAQPEPAAAAVETHEAETHEGGGIIDVVARLVNFAILAGTLVYLLRSPLAKYLEDRRTQIRSDLVNAAEMKQTAAAQIEEIERKMNALPGELEALRLQGAQEIAAEESRIRAAAAAERDRLLEQARREIDQQVKIAERELVSHAADLAVGVAAERIKKSITDDDQKRLVDRYVQQLKR